MKLKSPYIGIIAFLIILFTMPLGHAAMIIMEKFFGKELIYSAAFYVGTTGFFLLVIATQIKKQLTSVFLGLLSGLLIWTGWIEFAYVYFANRFGVEPLIENGEITTKPEYLIMPSSIGFLIVLLIYFLFNTKTTCPFFGWFQKKLKIQSTTTNNGNKPNNLAVTTVVELITILWFFYMVLLVLYDNNFFGDRHPVTYIVAIASLIWSVILFTKLIKIKNLAYALRYAIPVVIIFWNFVEIIGRWNILTEIWIEPAEYKTEMTLIFLALLFFILIFILNKKKSFFQKQSS